ncbi:hypothetical protein J2W83_003908 [Pseudomonas hunanensis]|uniref:Uncharacterized protein n=1 Tax=Pseudomonas hunanensis TaxID=1247546 RepID=A0ACC6K793_9PSED|nr:hypothetical protein [Pseudomonas hunanensis]MDR6714287.1 hypothetical protein [Pseudomonas hunanensis]
MSAFDSKNSEDFELVTLAITAALAQIEKHAKLPATQSSLAKQAKVHRNTIRNRSKDNSLIEGGLGWPLSELERIKRERAVGAVVSANLEKSDKDRIAHIESQLEIARRKAGHWFHRVIDMKRDLENLDVMRQRNETRIRILTEENNRLRQLKVVK